MSKQVITRFAPSPTGHLHLGHLYAARFARQFANQHHGQMKLRIEDIDHTRCRDAFYDAIFEDLAFMGIRFDDDVLKQSDRMDIYRQHLETLKAKDLIYPCLLSRRELDQLLSAPHQDKTVISNTDEILSAQEKKTRLDEGASPAWRLRMDVIRSQIPKINFTEFGAAAKEIDLNQIDDVVIARKDIGTSYHLSVVIDDAATGVTHVTRGDDLKDQTPIHRLLQCLLDLPETIWAHHPLITDHQGRRLAKRDDALSIKEMREKGMDKNDIEAALEQSSSTQDKLF